jgi:hypothetical protein
VNSAPIHGVSDQSGRFVTARSTPVYPAMQSPKKPPSATTTFPSPLSRKRANAGRRGRPSLVSAERNVRSESPPNTSRNHAPTDIGDHHLSIGVGNRSDMKSMCQKRSGRRRSITRIAPPITIAGNATRKAALADARRRPPPKRSASEPIAWHPPARPPMKK